LTFLCVTAEGGAAAPGAVAAAGAPWGADAAAPGSARGDAVAASGGALSVFGNGASCPAACRSGMTTAPAERSNAKTANVAVRIIGLFSRSEWEHFFCNVNLLPVAESH
jgi:hypothetical protein